MRPITLTMSAFGPYADKVKIDFDKLGQNGLYLITGDTGAGKTTIFDGISFALFDSPSGDIRDGSMLRSKYAKADTPTYVELVFENQGQKYTIRRNPKYERPQKHDKTKTTTEMPNADLILPNGKAISSQNKVNEEIVNILGLTRNQFAQIAMIAQGDFRKLLLSETKERQQIFRKIFKTDIFLEFQNKTIEKYAEIKNQRDKIKTGIEQYIQGIKGNGNEFYEKDLSLAKEGKLPIDEVFQLLENLINADNQLFEESKITSEKLSDEISQVTSKITKVKDRAEKVRQLEKVVKSLEELEEQKNKINSQLIENKENEEEIKKINEQVVLFENEYDKYKELDEKVLELIQMEKDIKSKSEEVKVEDDNIQLSKKELIELKEKLGSLSKAGENLINLGHQLENMKNLKTELKSYKDDLKDYKKAAEDYEEKRNEYLLAQSKAEKLGKEADEKRHLFNNEQAGILAETLVEGEPCPVCGSLEHPNKAVLTEGAPSKKEVEKAEAESQLALKKANEKSIEAGNLNGKKEAIKADLDKKRTKLLEIHGGDNESFDSNIKHRIDELKENITVVEKAIAEEKSKVEEKKNLEKIIPEKEEKNNNQEQAHIKRKEELIGLTTAYGAAEKHVNELKEKLSFPSGSELKKHVKNLQDKARTMTEQIELLKENLDKCQGEIKLYSGKKETMEKDLEKLEVVDSEGLDEQLARLTAKQTQLGEERNEIYARAANNQQVQENIKQNATNLSELDETMKWVGAIYQTANGRINGKERIMLETYVQMRYFDRIINRANIHLMKMSGGQYDLVRRTDLRSGNKQTGLELDVIDHYNGTSRTVKSLSGGESFIASLSLALGLSEEIQASAGGIKIDTMFVDEGFGSLDEETLDQAMRALAGLAEESRTIGIISHVAELRREIDNQIIVTKEKTGSRVEIIT